MARSELLETLEEFLFPSRFVRLSIAPLDAGLTPNDSLDELGGLFEQTFEDPDDMAVCPDGTVYVTSGRDVVTLPSETLTGGASSSTLPGEAGPIARERSGSLVIGVAGLVWSEWNQMDRWSSWPTASGWTRFTVPPISPSPATERSTSLMARRLITAMSGFTI